MSSMSIPSRERDVIGRLDTGDIVWYLLHILRLEHCYLLPYTSGLPAIRQAGLDQEFPYSYLEFIFFEKDKNLIVKR